MPSCEAERLGACSTKPGPSAATSSARAASSSVPSVATCSVQGSTRVAAGDAGAHPAKRLVPLRQRAAVLGGSAARAGARLGRACGRSRRGARSGPPFTTASRSGVKASAASRARSSSADASAAPFRRSSLALAGRDRHLGLDRSAAFARPSQPHAGRRARRSGRAAAPPACAGRSPARRRGAPRAGSSSRRRSGRPRARARARGRARARRTSGSSGAWPARRSAGQPDRHDQVEEVVALAVEQPRPQRADQLEPHRRRRSPTRARRAGTPR